MNIGRRRNKKTPKKYVCEEDSEEEEKSCLDDTIYNSGNKVYFYEDIYGELILKLKKVIEKISNWERLKQNIIQIPALNFISILMEVMSLWDLICITNIRQSSKFKKNYIDGMIASAATFIYLAGEKEIYFRLQSRLDSPVINQFLG